VHAHITETQTAETPI